MYAYNYVSARLFGWQGCACISTFDRARFLTYVKQYEFSIDMEAYFVEPSKSPASQVQVTILVPSERFYINYKRFGFSFIAQAFAAGIKQFQESFFYE